MHAVFLDADTYGSDFSLDELKTLPITWSFYQQTPQSELPKRIAEADIIATNKVPLTKELLERSRAKLICVTATGYDNIDISAAQALGIAVCNIPGYSTPSVAQHTMTLMLALAGSLIHYDRDIHSGKWQNSALFTFLDHPFIELSGKKLGIIGYGTIGRAVAHLAKAFGMEILIAEHTDPRKKIPGALPLQHVLQSADFLTLHVPLTPQTKHLISKSELNSMQNTAFLINTSRGALIDEEALAQALQSKTIAGAALDVLSKEPPDPSNPLLAPLPNLLITPHIGWASYASRKRSVAILQSNIKAWLAGSRHNRIDD